MTDGTLAQSHTGLKQDMAAIRRREALQAASMLGVSGDDVQFLGFRDGALAASEKQAVDFLRSQLEEFRPKQVFVPHRLDANVDHQATFRIGMAALSVTKVLAQVFEYPVWFWYHWPWVPISLKKRRGARKILKNSIHYRFGLQVVRSFNCRVSIENQQDAKRAALWAHQSQTTQLVPDPNWLTLGDIAQGQFLERFFQPYELFAHSRHIPA